MMFSPKNFFIKIPNYLALVVGAVLLLLLFDYSGVVQFREPGAYDFRLRVKPQQVAHPSIVVVEIDDDSVDALGSWPWRRNLHAEFINRLNELGAKAIFYDVLFPRPSENPQYDLEFIEAVKSAGNVILPFHFLSLNPVEVIYPMDSLREHLSEIGYANVEIDSDSLVRRFIPLLQIDGKVFYHSAIAVVLSLFNSEVEAIEWLKNLPVSEDKSILINYPGGLESFDRISFHDLLRQPEDDLKEYYLERLIRGKVVLVGKTSVGTTDLRATPIQTLLPGIAIQASAVHTLLSRQFLVYPPRWLSYLIILALALFMAWMSQSLPPYRALLMLPLICVLYTFVNIWVFCSFGVVFVLSLPIVAMCISYVLTLFFSHRQTSIERDVLGREMEMASQIQASLLPRSKAKIQGVDAFFKCVFFERVGGDLYDWADFGNGKSILCVGDVSGKGIPASLYMARALNEIRHSIGMDIRPDDVLKRLNLALGRGQTAGMFLTLAFVSIDRLEEKILISNAGHENVIYFDATTKQAELISLKKGVPLGITPDADYYLFERGYHKGDVLVLITDGVREHKNSKEEIYGYDRLKGLVENYAETCDAEELVQVILKDIELFSDGRANHDDSTVACVKI